MVNISPAIMLTGLSVGVFFHCIWPMECAAVLMLASLLFDFTLGYRNKFFEDSRVCWAATFLIVWVLWSAIGATWISEVPEIAWSTVAHDVIGISVLFSGLFYAQVEAENRWKNPLRAAAVFIIGVTIASWFSGDLIQRNPNIWAGVNVGLVANLMVPILILPFVVPSVRRGLNRWDCGLVILGLVIGLVLCWLTGRRLTMAALALAVCGGGVFQVPSRYLKTVLVMVSIGILAVLIATATGIMPGTQSGDALRPLVYRAAWDEFLAHPIWGIGPAGGYAVQEGVSESARVLTASAAFVVHAHSTALEVLVSGGSVGFILLITAGGCLVNSVRPSRLMEVGCVVGALLPAVLFDASPGSLLGNMWIPFVIGCACAGGSTRPIESQKAQRLLIPLWGLAATVAVVWLLVQSLAVARIIKNAPPERFLAAIQQIRNPDFISQFVSFIQTATKSQPKSDLLRTSLSAAKDRCGWFMRWPELVWSMRQLNPTVGDMDALAAVLRRSPFQDAPYDDLAAIDPARWSPALRTQAQKVALATAESPGIDGAVVVWRQTIAATITRHLSLEEKGRFGLVLEQYSEVPGVAAAGLWLYARSELDSSNTFARISMRLRLARTDASLFTGMMRSLSSEQLKRLMDLDRALNLGLPKIDAAP